VTGDTVTHRFARAICPKCDAVLSVDGAPTVLRRRSEICTFSAPCDDCALGVTYGFSRSNGVVVSNITPQFVGDVTVTVTDD